jgi:hypothetical protein
MSQGGSQCSLCYHCDSPPFHTSTFPENSLCRMQSSNMPEMGFQEPASGLKSRPAKCTAKYGGWWYEVTTGTVYGYAIQPMYWQCTSDATMSNVPATQQWYSMATPVGPRPFLLSCTGALVRVEVERKGRQHGRSCNGAAPHDDGITTVET